MLSKKIIIVVICIIVGTFAYRTIQVGSHGGHSYTIDVNGETYWTNEINIDSLHNRITFDNLGVSISAPLDRTTIAKW